MSRLVKLDPNKLASLIEEATVDCYNDEEQLSGFYCVLEEHLDFPFQVTVLGQQVSVEGLEQTDYDILAQCSSGPHRQLISLLHLPLPERPPAGLEWILAYRHWRG